jgi:lipopolysaccharide biosynthesis protein
VRLRTRVRAWRSRRTLVQAPEASRGGPYSWNGQPTGRRLGAFPDAWRSRDDLPLTHPASIGVVLHAYYPELLPELFERLQHIPLEYDLWITNATGAPIELPESMGRLRNSRVIEVENRGRDILPLVALVNAGYLDPYRVILKVHTKRSGWRAAHPGLAGDGTAWRLELLDSLVGGSERLAALLSAFAENPDLGIVTSDASVFGPEFWGDNEDRVAALLRRLELRLDPHRLRFAAGSMYWARGFVLQGLRALDLTAGDFEPEQGQVNATAAHAIERAIGLLAVEAGLSIVGASTLPPPAAAESYRWLERGVESARVRIVPFYLPQFHPIPENDKWWGEGFTEWTNVTAARPLYPGHYQPRLPRGLGFYDLRLDQVRREQLALAEAAGIEGFMYYHYWFAGKPLLHAPIDALVASDIPQQFCIMWANENWTRRWDGRQDDVLIGQDYERVPSEGFIDDILPLLADDRYMTVGGRKIVAVYRPGQIPDFEQVVAVWRRRAHAAGGGELFVLAVDVVAEFDGLGGDAVKLGVDGLLGFPPHNHQWTWLQGESLGIDPRFRGNLLSYEELAKHAEQRLSSGIERDYFPGVMVAFDNTPRRQWEPDLWYGANPYTFRRWLATAVGAVLDRPPQERLVFVNAWNEWAEGAVLEPTDRFGPTYLLALRDVVSA